MPETVTVRPFTDTDLDEVLGLLRRALGETPLLRRTPELFAWKHLDNPFGRSIMLVAEAGGRVVGFRSFMRWELLGPDGETVRCARPVDTATDPDFQRQGIFRRLTLEAVALAEEDVELIFNTPNASSGAGYASMGWVRVGGIGVLIRPTLRMLRARSADTEVAKPDAFLEQPQPAHDLTVSDRPGRGLRTPRTPGYLEWRFTGHPTARYLRVDTSGSTAVVRPNVRNGRRELALSDVFGTPLSSAMRLVVQRSRADYVVGSFSPGSPERKAAYRAGLIPVPAIRALTLYARPLAELSIDAMNLRSWDLALSDLELL